MGANDGGALYNAGDAIFVQQTDQCLSHAQFHECGLCVKGGIGAHGLYGGFYGFLFCGGICPQCVLYAVGQLCQNAIGDIVGALGHKVDADTLGTDQLDHLFDFLHQHFGGILK